MFLAVSPEVARLVVGILHADVEDKRLVVHDKGRGPLGVIEAELRRLIVTLRDDILGRTFLNGRRGRLPLAGRLRVQVLRLQLGELVDHRFDGLDLSARA